MLILYWLFVILCVGVSAFSIMKKNYGLGLLEIVITAVTVVFNYILLSSKGWMGSDVKMTQALIEKASGGSVSSILVLVGYVSMFIVTIYNLIDSRKKEAKNKDDKESTTQSA